MRDVEGGPAPEKMAVKYEIEDQVHDFGYVDKEELKFFCSKATLMVFPSLFEGFGLPLLEAMALECPVACYAYSQGKKVLIKHGL